MKYLFFGLVFLAIFFFFVSDIENTIKKIEINECLKWQQQALDYPLFWLTENQQKQCDYHGIEIN